MLFDLKVIITTVIIFVTTSLVLIIILSVMKTLVMSIITVGVMIFRFTDICSTAIALFVFFPFVLFCSDFLFSLLSSLSLLLLFPL